MILEIISVLIGAFIIRIMYVLTLAINFECNLEKYTPVRTLLCIGSGGHTSELLRLLKGLNSKKYNPRLYVAAENDVNSEVKIHNFEKDINSTAYEIHRIPRSRNVGQSYSTAVASTLYSIIYTIPVVVKLKPDLILCNGPGTCVPICGVAFLCRCLFILDCRIVFVESICRVQTLSLTGKLLQIFADLIIVQWPQLRDTCFRAKYYGRLT